MATFRKGNYVADLGAMVVTGLGESLFFFTTFSAADTEDFKYMSKMYVNMQQ